MKFPEAKGDQWNGDRDALVERATRGSREAASPTSTRDDEGVDGPEAPKTGMLVTQAPMMNRQLIENQHIVAMRPNWRAVTPNQVRSDAR